MVRRVLLRDSRRSVRFGAMGNVPCAQVPAQPLRCGLGTDEFLCPVVLLSFLF